MEFSKIEHEKMDSIPYSFNYILSEICKSLNFERQYKQVQRHIVCYVFFLRNEIR